MEELESELERIVDDLFSRKSLKRELEPKLLDIKVPEAYRGQVNVNLSLDSKELKFRLTDFKNFNEQYFQDEDRKKKLKQEKHAYFTGLEEYLLERASSSAFSVKDTELTTTVLGVVLRKFEEDRLSVLSFGSSESFVVKVPRNFPGLGRSVGVGDVLKVLKRPQDKCNFELISCYRLNVKDAMDFLDKLEASSKFFEDFVRCCAVWNYILNMEVTDNEERFELCRKVLKVCKIASSQHQAVVQKQFWTSFKRSRYLNQFLPEMVKETHLSPEDVKHVKVFIECIVQALPVYGIKALEILKSLNLKPDAENFTFICKMMSTLTVNVAGVKDEPEALPWNQTNLIPSVHEIFKAAKNKDLATNVKRDKKGKYSSEEEYLVTNFTLLREECFHGLNFGIKTFCEDSKIDPKNIMMYRVKFDKVKCDPFQQGLVFLLEFRCEQLLTPESDPDNSGWLMPGNLLCISLDNSFEKPIWATVAPTKNKDKLTEERKIVCVRLCTESNSFTEADVITKLQHLSDQGLEAYMCESSTFYLAFGPALDVLQHKESIAFKEQIVDVQKSTQAPQYLTQIKKQPDWSIIFPNPPDHKENGYNYDKLMEDFDMMKSDKESKPKLDEKQLEAVRKALCNDLVLIQGPPGTGKTHVGVTLLQFLLSVDALEQFGPILIVTYKNFSLDHFLESCLKKIPDFKSHLVRVGGGGATTDDDLIECKLSKLFSSKKRSSIWWQLTNQLEAMQPEIDDCIKALRSSLRYSNITHIFIEEASESQLKSLLEGENKNIFEKLTREKDFRVKHYEQLLKMLEGPLNKWLPTKENFDSQHLKINDVDNSSIINEADPDSDGADGITEVDASEVLKERCAALDEEETLDINWPQDTDSESNPHEKDDWILPEISNQKSRNFKSILNAGDIMELDTNERIQLVYALHGQYYTTASQRLSQMTEEFSKKSHMRKEFDDQAKIDILKECKVIGMTVSGAAINASWLETIKPSIMIVEEAAEILEPLLVAIIPSSVQHLIMIGDHMQLRPQVSYRHIGYSYQLQVSMFERLVTNDLDYTQLDTQGRMIDEIADLVRELDIYEHYKTREEDEKKSRPNSLKPMFFYTHTKEEQEKSETHSKYNQYEAEKIVDFAKFLCSSSCGIEQSDITILCSYRGQVAEIKKKRSEDLNSIEVTTIDSYQGKENHIILVSLVRSSANPKAKIGYLSAVNRICVTVSRAQCGLYFFGNSLLLKRKSRKGWKKIIDLMKEKDCVGDLEKSPPFCKDTSGATTGPAQASSNININVHGQFVQCGNNNTIIINQGSTSNTDDENPPEQQGAQGPPLGVPEQQLVSQSLEETGKSQAPQPLHAHASQEGHSFEETRKSDRPEPEAQEYSIDSLSSETGPSSSERQSLEETRKSDRPEPEAQELSWQDGEAFGSREPYGETHSEQETGSIDKRQPQQETESPVGKPVQDSNPNAAQKKD